MSKSSLASLLLCASWGCLSAFAQEGSPAASAEDPLPPTPEAIIAPIRNRLLADFDRRLIDPSVFSEQVRISCAAFPEGDLFPFIYPALAYINLGLSDPAQSDHCAKQADKLIALAIASTTKRVRPPAKDLALLAVYPRHAVYLGQLNLALNARSLLPAPNPHVPLAEKLSSLLHSALKEAKGGPLDSYPGMLWPFDTIPVLVSLRLHDQRNGTSGSDDVIQAHLRWVREKGTDPKLLLPYSELDVLSRKPSGPPRGCDLSFRLCFLPHLDREAASTLYSAYARQHWVERGGFAGFAEWPGGASGTADIDSGPVINGIGLGATGLGLGAVLAQNDRERLQRLSGQLASFPLVRSLFPASTAALPVQLDRKCFTGMLFGDAMLFYVLTWQPWVKGN